NQSSLLNSLSAVLYIGPIYLDLMGQAPGNIGGVASPGARFQGGREGRRGLFIKPDTDSVNGNEEDLHYRGLILGLKDTSVLKASVTVQSNGIWKEEYAADIDASSAI